ncbi:MAG TPA: hypothetical protein PLP50_04395 [Thermoanaerobaculia bacterium]|mgnify:CR=1 FL=1|nr:hypothetical protein [Thermoanaerobaculia bacterium]HPA50822.1 hypothetical protein [Thermoanaerobaculia bacterium]HQP86011.1 hypothetical protein [Thermoanaerobaculia bacterium]
MRARRPLSTVLVLSAAFMAAAPSSADAQSPEPAASDAPRKAAPGSPAPADEFLSRLAGLCGQAFEGRVVADEPAAPGSAFAGKRLVMHVRRCTAGEVRIPFHVGEDRSRTWVLTRTPDGLRLKHDHRHEDGTSDATTMYGGDTAAAGTAVRQEFPVDADSVAAFRREGLTASVTNVWAMEVEPGKRFLYELSRPGGRLFQVEFDLSKPLAPPPAPWGHD